MQCVQNETDFSLLLHQNPKTSLTVLFFSEVCHYLCIIKSRKCVSLPAFFLTHEVGQQLLLILVSKCLLNLFFPVSMTTDHCLSVLTSSCQTIPQLLPFLSALFSFGSSLICYPSQRLTNLFKNTSDCHCPALSPNVPSHCFWHKSETP